MELDLFDMASECTQLLPVRLFGHVTLHHFLKSFIFPGITGAGRQTLRGRFADFIRVARGWKDVGGFRRLGLGSGLSFPRT